MNDKSITSESGDQIALFLQKLRAALKNVPEPRSLVDLFQKQYKENLVAMVAFTKWLLERGESPESILHCGLLQDFFIWNFYRKDEVNSEIRQFYQMLRQDPDRNIQELCDLMATHTVKCTNDTDILNYKCTFAGEPATTDLPIAEVKTNLPLDPSSLLLSNQLELAQEVFGLDLVYLSLEVLCDALTIDNWISLANLKGYCEQALNSLLTEELVPLLTLFAQENATAMAVASKYTKINMLSSLLTAETVERLIEQGQWIVGVFINWRRHRSALESKREMIFDQLNLKTNSFDHSYSVHQLLCIRWMYEIADEEQDKEKLISIIYHHMRDIFQNHFENITLSDWILWDFFQKHCARPGVRQVETKCNYFKNIPVSFETFDRLKEKWFSLVDQYCHGEDPFPFLEMVPTNKSKFYPWFVAQMQKNKTSVSAQACIEFILKNEVDEKTKLQFLCDLLVQVDDESCLKEIILYLEKPPFRHNWCRFINSDDNEGIFKFEDIGQLLALNNLGLMKQINSMIDASQPFMTGVIAGDLAWVLTLLPSQMSLTIIDAGLEVAMQQGHLEVAQTLLTLTGDERPSQYGVYTALKRASDKVASNASFLQLIEIGLGLTTDNKLDQSGIFQLLQYAVKRDQKTVIETILTHGSDILMPDEAAVKRVFELSMSYSCIEMVHHIQNKISVNQMVLWILSTYISGKHKLILIEACLKDKIDARLTGETTQSITELACKEDDRAFIDVCLDLAANNKLKRLFVDNILYHAILLKKWEIAEKCLELTGCGKPGRAQVDALLDHASCAAQVSIVQKCLAMQGPNQPSLDQISQIRSKNLYNTGKALEEVNKVTNLLQQTEDAAYAVESLVESLLGLGIKLNVNTLAQWKESLKLREAAYHLQKKGQENIQLSDLYEEEVATMLDAFDGYSARLALNYAPNELWNDLRRLAVYFLTAEGLPENGLTIAEMKEAGITDAFITAICKANDTKSSKDSFRALTNIIDLSCVSPSHRYDFRSKELRLYIATREQPGETKTISKETYKQVLETYITWSYWKYFINIVAICLGLPPVKSKLMCELEKILNTLKDGELVEQSVINQAINRVTSPQQERWYCLFQGNKTLKSQSGSEEVLIQLNDKYAMEGHGSHL